MKNFTYFIKDGANPDYQTMHPQIFVVLGHLFMWCQSNDLTCTLTSTNETVGFNRKSRSHKEGRAVDVRTWNFTEKQLDQLTAYLEETCGHLGAYSASDMKQRLVVRHGTEAGGRGDHLHLQVKPSIDKIKHYTIAKN